MARCKICDSEKTRIKLSLDLAGASSKMAFCAECARKFEMDVNALERKGLPEYLGRCKAFAEFCDSRETSCRTCPNCELTSDEVLAMGKAGCAFCYVVFSDLPVHKAPRRKVLDGFAAVNDSDCIHESPEILKRMLQEAVSVEDYEKAARLRDRLRGTDASDGS